MVISSAYEMIWMPSGGVGMSRMYALNRAGDMIDPCGTPVWMVLWGEEWLRKVVKALRPRMYVESHFVMAGGSEELSSSWMSVRWSTVSNAFVRSRATMTVR